jgi:hypothetical protein
MNRFYWDAKLLKWVSKLPTYTIVKKVVVKQHGINKYQHTYGFVNPRGLHFEPSMIGKKVAIYLIEIEGDENNGNKTKTNETSEERNTKASRTRAGRGTATGTTQEDRTITI